VLTEASRCRWGGEGASGGGVLPDGGAPVIYGILGRVLQQGAEEGGSEGLPDRGKRERMGRAHCRERNGSTATRRRCRRQQSGRSART
jgi:hypothetical protein